MHFFYLANALFAITLSSCGVDGYSGLTSELNQRPCIRHFTEYPKYQSARDQAGHAIAHASDGKRAFVLQVEWDLHGGSGLVYKEPVNKVRLRFFDPQGRPAQSVELGSFDLTMDMGGRAHSTNECPAQKPQVTKLSEHEFEISHINFVMASRQPNKWFIHNFQATVNDKAGRIARWNIPYTVL